MRLMQDPEHYSRSKMGSILEIAIVPADIVVPAAVEHCSVITGRQPDPYVT